MFTVCPKCALTLVVTAADLRVAQGYVRCGRCSSVFNALARLTDDRQAAESLSESQQPLPARADSTHAAKYTEPTELPAHSETAGAISHGELPHDEAPPHDATHDQPLQQVAPHDQPHDPPHDEPAAGEARHGDPRDPAHEPPPHESHASHEPPPHEAARHAPPDDLTPPHDPVLHDLPPPQEATHDQSPQQVATNDEALALEEPPQAAADFSAPPETPAVEDYGEPHAAVTTPPTDAPGSAPAAATEDEVIPESALEFDPTTTDVARVFIEPPPDLAWTAATGTFKAMLAGSQPPATEASSPKGSSSRASSIVPSASQGARVQSVSEPAEPGPPGSTEAPLSVSTAAHEPKPEAIARPQPSTPGRGAPARGPQAPRAVPLRFTPRHDPLHGRPPAAAEAQRPAPAPAPAEGPDDRDLTAAVDLIEETRRSHKAEGEGRVRPAVWAAAIAIASLVLLVQIVHHYRDELAAQPGLNRPLTALYAALGMPLVPRWDVRAYDVRQLGAVADPANAGLITVRASIKNGAPQAQPLPLLRVTLQDRFGNRIAARDVAPHSYLPHAVSASSFIGAGERIDAEMGFVDPGANAVGFEIDACLPQRGGGIVCANDSALR